VDRIRLTARCDLFFQLSCQLFVRDERQVFRLLPGLSRVLKAVRHRAARCGAQEALLSERVEIDARPADIGLSAIGSRCGRWATRLPRRRLQPIYEAATARPRAQRALPASFCSSAPATTTAGATFPPRALQRRNLTRTRCVILRLLSGIRHRCLRSHPGVRFALQGHRP
jgi:hypothetical protein